MEPPLDAAAGHDSKSAAKAEKSTAVTFAVEAGGGDGGDAAKKSSPSSPADRRATSTLAQRRKAAKRRAAKRRKEEKRSGKMRQLTEAPPLTDAAAARIRSAVHSPAGDRSLLRKLKGLSHVAMVRELLDRGLIPPSGATPALTAPRSELEHKLRTHLVQRLLQAEEAESAHAEALVAAEMQLKRPQQVKWARLQVGKRLVWMERLVVSGERPREPELYIDGGSPTATSAAAKPLSPSSRGGGAGAAGLAAAPRSPLHSASARKTARERAEELREQTRRRAVRMRASRAKSERAAKKKMVPTAMRSPCAVCEVSFTKDNLPGVTTMRKVWQLRQRWGMHMPHGRRNWFNQLYSIVRVCVFCAQFFDQSLGRPGEGTGVIQGGRLLKSGRRASFLSMTPAGSGGGWRESSGKGSSALDELLGPELVAYLEAGELPPQLAVSSPAAAAGEEGGGDAGSEAGSAVSDDSYSVVVKADRSVVVKAKPKRRKAKSNKKGLPADSPLRKLAAATAAAKREAAAADAAAAAAAAEASPAGFRPPPSPIRPLSAAHSSRSRGSSPRMRRVISLRKQRPATASSGSRHRRHRSRHHYSHRPTRPSPSSSAKRRAEEEGEEGTGEQGGTVHAAGERAARGSHARRPKSAVPTGFGSSSPRRPFTGGGGDSEGVEEISGGVRRNRLHEGKLKRRRPPPLQPFDRPSRHRDKAK
eukprot:PLAT6859.3.p1 GENE.PLAT6859.3~~PLAT6859.3.p1  ORF type:complete len:702 (-),score=254.47 PLAT6859.3:63-2168(-)